jgi:hypothetical protein
MGHCSLEESKSAILQPKVLILILLWAIFVLSGCRSNSESHRQLAAPAAQESVATKGKPMLRQCPDGPYRKLQAKDPTTGHHRVFLTWNASTSTSESDPNSFGYCLYRTQTPGKAKDCPAKYPKCEQVNVLPVRGTRCVDELVKDSTTYYYVAIGVTASDKSTTSEEAIAEVPAAGKRKPPPPDAASYPACRMPTPAAPPSHP